MLSRALQTVSISFHYVLSCKKGPEGRRTSLDRHPDKNAYIQYNLRNRKSIPYKNVLFLFSLYYCINIKYVAGIKIKVSAYCLYLYYILSCQLGVTVTVTLCFVFKVIRDLKSICHSCIDPIHRIGLMHK